MIHFNVDTRLERSLVVIEVAKFEEGEEGTLNSIPRVLHSWKIGNRWKG